MQVPDDVVHFVALHVAHAESSAKDRKQYLTTLCNRMLKDAEVLKQLDFAARRHGCVSPTATEVILAYRNAVSPTTDHAAIDAFSPSNATALHHAVRILIEECSSLTLAADGSILKRMYIV